MKLIRGFSVVLAVLMFLYAGLTVCADTAPVYSNVTATFTLLGCSASNFETSPLEVSARELRTIPRLETKGSSRNSPAVSMSLAPGPYHVFIHKDGCAGGADVVLLPRHNVSLVFFGMQTARMTDGQGAFSGSVPTDGLTVAFVFKSLRGSSGSNVSPDGFAQKWAVMQGRQYYFLDAPAGIEGTIRLYDANNRWFDVGTLTLTLGQTELRYVTKDITANDLRLAHVVGY